MVDLCVSIFFIVYLLVGLRCTLLVDSLIRWLHKKDNDIWESLGKPRGLFFNPSQSSYISYICLSFQLSFHKPCWLADSLFADTLYAKFNFWQKIGLFLSVFILPVMAISLTLK